MWRRRTRKRTGRRVGQAAGAIVAAAAAHKAFDKVQVLRVKRAAQKTGIGDERIDTSK